MVVPSATSRDAVLELVKQKDAIEQKIADQGKILEAVSFPTIELRIVILILNGCSNRIVWECMTRWWTIPVSLGTTSMCTRCDRLDTR